MTEATSSDDTAEAEHLPRLAYLLAMAMFVLVEDTSLMNVSISAVVDDLDTTVSGVQSAITLEALVSAALARQLARESGLSYPDYLVLVALTDRPDGTMRLFELAGVLGWEKSRLSHHVARMEARGVVKKERCDTDRRGAFVVVTERGRTEIEAAAPGHVAAVRRLFVDRLTPSQLESIGEAAEAVLAGFDEPADRPQGSYRGGARVR